MLDQSVTGENNPILELSEGQVVVGTVVNVAPFGLFISLAPRLDGLLRFERTPYPEIARRFQVGDTVDVLVRSINMEHLNVLLELVPDPTRYEGFWKKTAE